MPLRELVGGAIGVTLVAVGAVSMGAWALRRRAAERLLLLFGISCLLYGLRLIAEQPAVDLSIGGAGRTWHYLIAFITYTIVVPIGLFFEALVGRGWKQSVRRIWQVQAVYAVLAVVTDLAAGRPAVAMGPNKVLVLAGVGVGTVNVWLYRTRLPGVFATRILVLGALALLVGVVNQNLGGPISPAVDLEPVGVLIFVATLGYSVIGHVFRSEAELLAVQRELETAREIQRSLLPDGPPRVRGIELAVRYLPMTAVAGDLYDFVEQGRSGLGILVADVSGHGVPAALVASMVKLAFSTEGAHAHDPARVLGGMNRALSRQLRQAFVTAVYAFIDTDRRTMTVANAGHPPVLVGRAGGSVETVGEHGLLLGFVPEVSYTNTVLDLRDGDLVLLYTDGVTEARNPAGEYFDGGHVERWLAASDGRDIGHFADESLRDLTAWRGRATFEDDVTLIAARVTQAD